MVVFSRKNRPKTGQKRGYFSLKTLELPFLIFQRENRFPGRFWPLFFCIEDKDRFFGAEPLCFRYPLFPCKIPPQKGQKGIFGIEDKEQKWWFLGVKRDQKQSKNGQKRGYFSPKTLELPFLIFYTKNRFPGRFWPFFRPLRHKDRFFEAEPLCFSTPFSRVKYPPKKG